MRKILLIILFILFPTVVLAAVFNSSQVGSSPVSGYYLKTDGSVSTWAPVAGGGSGGGTWATTTSNVANQFINYSNNTTDIVVVGSTATTSAKFYFDPNTNTFRWTGNATSTGVFTAGINVTAPFFNATGTTASILPYASSTGLTATNFFTTNAIHTGSTTLQSFTGTNATTTNATTTSLGITNAPSALLLTDANGSVGKYTGTSCTNQFPRSLSALGAATCASVANTDLSNSTISGIALGSNLANLTATDGTLTFSGTYNGSTARTIGLNLGNNNIWTASTTFQKQTNMQQASTTALTVSGSTYLDTGNNDSVQIGSTVAPQLDAFGTKPYELQISNNINDVVGQAVYNRSTGTSAAAGLFFQNANSPLGGIGATQTYYAGMAYAGSNWNGVPLGFGALPPNGFVVYNTDGKLILGSATSTGEVDFYTGAGSFGGGIPDAILTSAGNFGVATNTLTARLSVHLNNGDSMRNAFTIGSSTQTATTTLFTILNTGNTGISTTTPGTMLGVVGDTFVTGHVTAKDYVSTSTISSNVFPYASTTVLSAGTICFTSDTCRTTWPTGGGSGGGTWSTTTSKVSGHLINYPNNATDVVVIGGTATTSFSGNPIWFDPNSDNNTDATFHLDADTATSSLLNFIVGSNAGQAITTGSHDVGIGDHSMRLTTTGSENAFTGLNSGYQSNGFDNVGFGNSTLYNSKGNNNSALGQLAGFTNVVGDNNVFAGTEAGYFTNASSSIIIGAFVDSPFLTTNGILNIGNVLYGSGIYNQSPIAPSIGVVSSAPTTAGRIAIGTTTPYARLTVWGVDTGATKAFEISDSASTTIFSVLDNGKTTSLYASSTAISAPTVCVGTDCRTAWPSSGGGTYPFVPATTYNTISSGTSTPLWLQGSPYSLFASSTAVFTYASSTAFSASNLVSGNCVQASTGGLLTTSSSACGTGGGVGWASTTATLGRTNGSVQSTADTYGIGTSTQFANHLISTATSTGVNIVIGNAGTTNPPWGLSTNNGDFVFSTTSLTTGATSTALVIIKANAAPGVSIGSSTPFATLSVNPRAGDFSNQFVVGSSTATNFRIDNSGNIFAPNTISSGSSQTGYWCYDTNGQLIRDSAVCLVSALKFKKDVKNLDVGLNELMQLRPVSYLKKDPLDKSDSGRQMGFIADEVAKNSKLNEMLVTYDSNGDVHGFRYEQFTALITKSVQELNLKIEKATRSTEENWQWVVIILLGLGMGYQQYQIRKLKK